MHMHGALRTAHSSPAKRQLHRAHAHLRGTFGQNFLTTQVIRRNQWSPRTNYSRPQQDQIEYGGLPVGQPWRGGEG
jgi:hypothetical protein